MFGLLSNCIKIRKPHLVVGEKILRGLIKNGLIIISVFSVSEKKSCQLVKSSLTFIEIEQCVILLMFDIFFGKLVVY